MTIPSPLQYFPSRTIQSNNKNKGGLCHFPLSLSLSTCDQYAYLFPFDCSWPDAAIIGHFFLETYLWSSKCHLISKTSYIALLSYTGGWPHFILTQNIFQTWIFNSKKPSVTQTFWLLLLTSCPHYLDLEPPDPFGFFSMRLAQINSSIINTFESHTPLAFNSTCHLLIPNSLGSDGIADCKSLPTNLSCTLWQRSNLLISWWLMLASSSVSKCFAFSFIFNPIQLLSRSVMARTLINHTWNTSSPSLI